MCIRDRPYFDAVLLENHGALTWSTDLNAAYMKMESVEFYAQLLYQSKLLGGPKEFDKENIKKLYEIRRKFGMPGKHPANLCQNKDGVNCHNCGGACHSQDYKQFPGYQYDFVAVSYTHLDVYKRQLYALGDKCGGNFRMTETGIKDCTNCQLPHKAQNYGYVTGKYSELAELMKKIRENKE